MRHVQEWYDALSEPWRMLCALGVVSVGLAALQSGSATQAIGAVILMGVVASRIWWAWVRL